MQKLTNNLFQFEDLPLTQLSHTFAQSSVWLAEKMHKQIATYDLVVREMPKNRNYMVAAGLEEIIYYLKNYKYTKEQIKFLLDGKLITPEFAKYMEKLKFTGEVTAMPEGTVFFPGEPIVRITAPIIEASLVEVFMFNIAVSNIIFTSKAARIRSLLKENISTSTGMQRAQSFESGMKGVRAGEICGLGSGGVWTSFVKKYNLPHPKYIINGQHLFIKSFPDEITAFRKMVEYFDEKASFMIDTYNFDKGLKNAITVGKELKAKGKNLRLITIDAGDLEKLTKKVRKELDKNGLQETKILVASNLDEYKIKKLLDKKTPADIFVSATEYATVADSPKLEVVYKMAELRNGKNIQHTAKLTPGKESYPGRKQVFRKYNKAGKMTGDVIGLENEKLGTPLLKTYMRNGVIIKEVPDLPKIRRYFDKQFKIIPERLLELEKEVKYPVKVSSKLQKLFDKIKSEH